MNPQKEHQNNYYEYISLNIIHNNLENAFNELYKIEDKIQETKLIAQQENDEDAVWNYEEQEELLDKFRDILLTLEKTIEESDLLKFEKINKLNFMSCTSDLVKELKEKGEN